MIKIRKSKERGHFNYGWLDTFHTFSFSQYYNQEYNGFNSLRVINEDKIQPGEGFDTHGHKDMEIITYIVSGALEHKDSMGNKFVVKKGEIQKMSAGTGVKHSEFNHSKTQPVHLLQIWILPTKSNLPPDYQQKEIEFKDKLNLLISPKKNNNSLTINQDVELYVSKLKKDEKINYNLSRNNAWLQLINGQITINNQKLESGDGATITQEKSLEIKSITDSEFLLFDLI